MSGEPVERADLPSLKISVAHAIVQAPNNITEFPKWGDMTLVPEVTAGRPAGAEIDDD